MLKAVFFFILFPALCFAQTEVTLQKDFAVEVNSLGPTAGFNNDKQKVITVSNKGGETTVALIKEDLSMVWSVNVTGPVAFTGIFNNKVVVVSQHVWPESKKDLTYTVHLLDAATGKLITEKPVFNISAASYIRNHVSLTGDGKYLNLAVVELKAPPAVQLFGQDQLSVKDIIALTIDENLTVTNTFHPAVKDGDLLYTEYDRSGNLYIASYATGNISLTKYQTQAQPVSQITEAYDVPKRAKPFYYFSNSTVNPDVLYMAASYVDNDVCKMKLTKLNFATQKSQSVTDDFNKDVLKGLEKSNAPSSNLSAFNLTSTYFAVRGLTEQNGKLLVLLSTNYTTPNVFHMQGSLVVSGYDADLSHKYYQVMPAGYEIRAVYFGSKLDPSYDFRDGLLNIVAPLKQDGVLFGSLDVTTGTWKKMALLSTQLGMYNLPYTTQTMWFGSSFAIPYIEKKGMMRNLQNVSLHRFTYK